VKELFDKLTQVSRFTVLTGAGISAESGVPTFRGKEGLWKKHKPEDLATPQAFTRNPELVWEWYHYRREMAEKASPNPGHYALVELEALLANFTLITQNVDNLHVRAGSKNLLELHGNIFRARCSRDGMVFQLPSTSETLPHCPACGELLRPDIVWFGEALPEQEMKRAAAASIEADYFLVVGTSGLVYPAAGLPLLAHQNLAMIIEINPEKTPLSEFTVYCPGKASEILPLLVETVKFQLSVS